MALSLPSSWKRGKEVGDARTCLVTGAGRGIGRAVAVALASHGHRLVLTSRTAADLGQTAALCAPAPTCIQVADVTDPEAVEGVFATAEGTFGPVEVLVTCAGEAVSASIRRTDDDLWFSMLDVHLTAPFRFLRRALPGMIAGGYGRIVVVGSTASREGAPYVCAYTAAKHGVLGLVRSAALEVARTGVTVNAVCPGFVDTSLTDASVRRIAERTGRTEEEARAELAGRQPIGRLIAPDEVARAILYLIGEPAVTGQGLMVDGGSVMA